MKQSTSPNAMGGHVVRGVTLIELMVGMAIGLLSVVVITQVMVQAEGQKRSATSGSDAQVNGALAMDMLQREIRSSGYGLVTETPAVGCPMVGDRLGKKLLPANAWVLTAVNIVDGTDGAPDQIRVLRSDHSGPAAVLKTAEVHAAGSTQFAMVNNVTEHVSPGDVMVAIPPPRTEEDIENGITRHCTVFSVTGAASSPDKTLAHVANTTTGAWNVVPSNFPAAGYPKDTALVNAGRLVNRNYSIEGAQLTRTAFSSETGEFLAPEPMFPQIVNLQAVYGKTPSIKASPVVWDASVPVTWTDVFAVRFALVARSGQREKDEVTTSAPTWTPDGETAVTIKLDADPDWKYYRYKVYETVVPLRNRLWHNMTAEEAKAESAAAGAAP